MGVIDGDLVSYADRRYSTGKLYILMGIEEFGIVVIKCLYIKTKKGVSIKTLPNFTTRYYYFILHAQNTDATVEGVLTKD